MRKKPILLWHNQRGLWWRTNYRLKLFQHSREQQDLLPHTRSQRRGQIKNTSKTFSMAINTYPKRSQSKNQIRNWPITTDNINISESIYGPQISIIQGKTIIRSPEHHKTIPRIPLPPCMAKRHHNEELSMDFFFVNGIPFLSTK